MDAIGWEVVASNQHEDLAVNDFAACGIPSLIVRRQVFNPVQSFSAKFFASQLPSLANVYVGRDTLDLGCGCGILGLIMGVHGAASVTFADISHPSVANAEENARSYGLLARSIQSDLLDGIGEVTFGVIAFNPPGISGSQTDDLIMNSVFSDDSLLIRFFESVGRYLDPDGIILMPTSSRHEISRRPSTYAQHFGFTVERLTLATVQKGISQEVVGLRPTG